MEEHERRGGQRVEQFVELDCEHGFRGRQRHQVDLRRDDQAERAFRADDQLREIEGL